MTAPLHATFYNNRETSADANMTIKGQFYALVHRLVDNSSKPHDILLNSLLWEIGKPGTGFNKVAVAEYQPGCFYVSARVVGADEILVVEKFKLALESNQ